MSSGVQTALIHQMLPDLQTQMGQRVSAVTRLEHGSGWSRLHPGGEGQVGKQEVGPLVNSDFKLLMLILLSYQTHLQNHKFKGKFLRSSRGQPQSINPDSVNNK